MSRTTKDKYKVSKRNLENGTASHNLGIGKMVKEEAKSKRKKLKNESNPRVAKIVSADPWHWD